jgi:rhodanese-related sulfurtransferase
MPNDFGAPEISVKDVATKVAANEEFIWLDVREPDELDAATINDARVVNVPMSELAQKQTAALPDEAQDQEAEIIVFCHHGGRSGQVTAWLRGQGWQNVVNMGGGIDSWARNVDSSVGQY